MPEDSVPSPANSIWGKLSISFAGTGCAVLLLFCFYKLIRNRCLSLCAHLPNESFQEGHSLEIKSGGLSADVVSSLQAVQYRKENREGDSGSGSSDCAICLAEFREGERLRVLPNCSHSFHLPCIDTWLCSHSDCPLCRKQVLGDFDNSCSCIPMMPVSLETLPREGINRVRPLDHHLLESEATRNEVLRLEARGLQSLMWL